MLLYIYVLQYFEVKYLETIVQTITRKGGFSLITVIKKSDKVSFKIKYSMKILLKKST